MASLTKFFNICQDTKGCRLNRELVQSVANRNSHARRLLEYTVIKANTEQMRKGFLPSAVQAWNNLPEEKKRVQSPTALKNMPVHRPCPNPVYKVEHTRKTSIDMRNQNGNLGEKLVSKQLEQEPYCDCGLIETDVQYFEI